MACFVPYWIACWRPPASRRTILAVALILRGAALPLAPSLSEDVHRYWWEGKVQAEGGNPYLVRPDDDRVPAKGFRAGYGPLIELIEWGSYQVASRAARERDAQVAWMKLPAVVCELATLALLGGLPARQLVIYAWSPAPVVEFWWNGHNDAVPVFLLVLTLRLASAGRWAWAFAALGLGISAKWWPAILLPALVWRNRRWAWLPFPIVFLTALPYSILAHWRDYIENARFMSGFVGGWRNNDSLFGALLELTGNPYHAKYAAFALAGMAAVWMMRWPLERAALGTLTALLLLSSNCHPWYLTWLTPLLPFHPWPPLLLWQGLMPLAYAVNVDWMILREWDGSRPDRWFIYVPVFAAMAGWAAAGGMPGSRRR